MKLFTSVNVPKLSVQTSLQDKVAVLGSCFADNVGERLADAGFQVCANPFGTLYNPASILSAVRRLGSAEPFTEKDCVEMGAGAGKTCSFSHHTSFARADAVSFLANANASLADASAFWKECRKVMVTLGTAMVWKHDGMVVSNCLKRPSAEFTHEMLSVDEVTSILEEMVSSNPDKEFIFTVSPIRHLSQGAHLNTLSKSTLHLALSRLEGKVEYFPAYEILLDELRDYRFYSEDLVHPAKVAVDIIWDRFLEAAVPESEWQTVRENERAARRAAHRPILEKE